MISYIISELRSTSKPGEKQDILKKYDSVLLREILRSTYDPFLLHHVKISKKDIPNPGGLRFSDISDKLMAHVVACQNCNSNKVNRERTVEFLRLLDEGSQELLISILDKNLKAGLGVRNILKVYPGLVPRFEVQLANTYDKNKEYKNSLWLASPKLDGVRAVALRVNDQWYLYSRQGHPFITVDHLIPYLEELYLSLGYTCFDGELYLYGLSFEEIQGAVMSSTQIGKASHIQYHVFVAGMAGDFLNQVDTSFVLTTPAMESDFIKPVKHSLIHKDDIYEVLAEHFAEGYEGIMLKTPDKLYDYKRSDAIVKLKKSEDMELSEEKTDDCLILAIETDDYPVINDGVMAYENLLVRLIVQQKDGMVCKVGSGFSLDFRRDPGDIVGKVCEITYQGKGAKGRMRFPRLERIREDINWGE